MAGNFCFWNAHHGVAKRLGPAFHDARGRQDETLQLLSWAQSFGLYLKSFGP